MIPYYTHPDGTMYRLNGAKLELYSLTLNTWVVADMDGCPKSEITSIIDACKFAIALTKSV